MDYTNVMLTMMLLIAVFVINFVLMPATARQAVHSESKPYRFPAMIMIIFTAWICTATHVALLIHAAISGSVAGVLTCGSLLVALIVYAYHCTKLEKART